MTEAAAIAPSTVESTGIPPASLAYRRYALGILLVVYMLNFLDRQVVNILAEPIKKDLHLKDWQLGAMGGAAFALLYTFLAIPIARLAGRWNRPAIIAGSLALWSGFTVLCGFAQNFAQLCLARVGVGFGEAGCTPSAHSIIADDTPPKDRAFALAFYAMGTPLGGLLGLILGAVVNHAYGWRVAFMVAGAPGLIFTLLVLFTLKEPRRRIAARVAQVRAEQATLVETLRYLAGKPTFWLVAFSASISAFIGYGQAQFTASFFVRAHGAELNGMAATLFGGDGLLFYAVVGGLIGGLAGAAGSVLGGKITDWATARDIKAYVTVPAISGALWAPLYVMSVLAPTAKLALGLGVFSAVLGTLWYGPVYAIAQSVVPPNMRATAAALMLFIINIVGLGLGPVFTGAVSGYLSSPTRLGAEHGAQWALIVTAGFIVFAILLTLLARRTVKADLVS